MADGLPEQFYVATCGHSNGAKRCLSLCFAMMVYCFSAMSSRTFYSKNQPIKCIIMSKWHATKAIKGRRGRPSKDIPARKKKTVSHVAKRISKVLIYRLVITFPLPLLAQITPSRGMNVASIANVLSAMAPGRVWRLSTDGTLSGTWGSKPSKRLKKGVGKSIKSKIGKR